MLRIQKCVRVMTGVCVGLALVFVLGGMASACTTFLSEGQGSMRVGKSYDWDQEQGIVFVNPSGLEKAGISLKPGMKVARWTSQYSSVTFNQYGREMPNGGINEKGLVVEVMWLRETQLPREMTRPLLNELQWIQYQLDTSATVEEMVRNAQRVQVSAIDGKVHYLGCDSTGACAAFEYLNGDISVTQGKALVAKVLTNDTYSNSAAYLGTRKGFGGKARIPEGSGSLARFARAANGVKGGKGADREGAFALLEQVHAGERTQWQIVYDPKDMHVAYRTRSNSNMREIEVRTLFRTCKKDALMFPMEAGKGDITGSFVSATYEANKQLIAIGVKALGLPPFLTTVFAAYPSSVTCSLP